MQTVESYLTRLGGTMQSRQKLARSLSIFVRVSTVGGSTGHKALRGL